MKCWLSYQQPIQSLSDPDKCGHYHWSNDCWHVNYFNYSRNTGEGKYGFFNKNDGSWTMKNSQTFLARGLCSRTSMWTSSSTKVHDILLLVYLYRFKVLKYTKNCLVENDNYLINCECSHHNILAVVYINYIITYWTIFNPLQLPRNQ